jgi:hypothetical protein
MMRGALLAGAALVAAPASGHEPQSITLEDARIVFDGAEVVISNSRIARRMAWNDGALATVWLGFGDGGEGWVMTPQAPDLAPLGTLEVPADASLSLRQVEASAIRPAHLELTLETGGKDIAVRRTCRVFPRVPAIPCTIAYRGAPRARGGGAANARDVIESADLASSPVGDVIDRLALPPGHWAFTATAFRAATDYHDWLVVDQPGELYRQPLALTANVLTLADRFGPGQVFVIKEAPLGADQIVFPGHDLVLQAGDVRIEGSGIDPATLSPDRWQEGHTVTIGVSPHGEAALLLARRDYMATRRTYDPSRDGMILMNTWGDRNRDAAMSESFALAQLEAAKGMGLTHLQLDDGWQAGLSKNSAAKDGKLWEEWSTASWQPHPDRFPRGLGPVVARANELGMEIGLWFNPTRRDDYALWERDADILIGLYRQYGIRIFKIDGIEQPTRAAAANLEKMFAKVHGATDGKAVFNLDATAGRRPGYLDPVNAYGNLFVENRYTDWGNYYPYRTLRNLWMLAAHVPPQFLQIEFLNTARNPDRYPPGDPLAPARAGQDYAFAVTMMAQPLAWLEATGMPKGAFADPELIRTYRAHAARIHAGHILPIGEQPDGSAWTGFQSVAPGQRTGYLLVLREANARAEVSVRTLLPPGSRVRLTPVTGSGKPADLSVSAAGHVTLALPVPHSFALYSYTLLD